MSELAQRHVGDGLDDVAGVIAQLRAARKEIGHLTDVSVMAEMRLRAKMLAAAARVRRAEDVVREANETRIWCERRIGEVLLASRGTSHLATAGDEIRLRQETYKTLASIPEMMFRSIVRSMIESGLAADPLRVIGRAREQSLKRVEPGIFESFDGWYYIGKDKASAKQTKSKVLSVAQGQSREGMRVAPRSSEREALDSAHATARRLAQTISNLAPTLTGDSRTAVDRAEHLLGEAATLLFQAWLLER